MDDKVAIPNNADEAAAMLRIAAHWLQDNAPEVLRATLRSTEHAKDAERWRWWRNRWPALCRMEVARFAGLDLTSTYVQSPADMDAVTDAAMQAP